MRVVKSYKRILGANHQLHNVTYRCPCPLGNLIWQIIKGCLVSEGEKEKNSIYLFLTGLEDSELWFMSWWLWFGSVWKHSTCRIYTYWQKMVKSAQGILSTVPQLQTEEKYFATFSQLHWPIHHCCLNTLNNKSYTGLPLITHKYSISIEQGPTYCFIVHGWDIQACQTCS